MELKFYKCNICNKVITMVNPAKVDTFCCGQPMVELKPNTTDAAIEKHVPVINIQGTKAIVTVGSVNHPMEEKHYIQWICVETNLGHQIKYLKPNDLPKACFQLCDNEKIANVYAYCNLHGLWKKN